MAWTSPRTWVTSETVTSTTMNSAVRDNLGELWHELAYQEFASSVLMNTAVLENAPTDVVSAGAVTYSGFPIIVEFYCPGSTGGTTTGGLNLWEDSTDKGRLTHTSVSNGSAMLTISVQRRYTPASGSKTLKVRGWNTGANTWTALAGAGGVGTAMPGYIRVLEKGAA
jgi:hypothetical protein